MDMTAPPARAATRENLSMQAERIISESLMMGHYRPGQRLKINELARKLGTSATPIREALSRLAASGIVEFAPAQSVRVPDFNPTKYEELNDIRLANEGLACFRAAERITATELRTLDSLHNEYLRCVQTNDIDKGLIANKAFRFAVYEAAKMPKLLNIITNLWVQSVPALKIIYTTELSNPMLERAYSDLMIALRSGDPHRARAAVHEAILIGTRQLREKLQMKDRW